MGLVIDLAVEGPIGEVTIDSPTRGWSVEAKVATGAPTTLIAWGPTVASATDVRGTVTLDLHRARGNAILLWITQLSESPPWQVVITDVIVTS